MLSATSQPASSPRHQNVTLLAVSANPDDRRSLESILDSPGWTIQSAVSLREATRLLKGKPSLIVCDRDLPDGSWKDLLRQALKLDKPPAVVVVSRHADQRLWAEVLNLGAFDVLLRPFEKMEVTRVVGMAARCFQAATVAA